MYWRKIQAGLHPESGIMKKPAQIKARMQSEGKHGQNCIWNLAQRRAETWVELHRVQHEAGQNPIWIKAGI